MSATEIMARIERARQHERECVRKAHYHSGCRHERALTMLAKWERERRWWQQQLNEMAEAVR